MGVRAQRQLLRQHDLHDLQGGQDAVAGPGILGEDDVAGLLAADTYSSGLRDAFADACAAKGLEVVAEESVASMTEVDYTNQFNKMVSAGAQLVFTPFYYDVMGPYLVLGGGSVRRHGQSVLSVIGTILSFLCILIAFWHQQTVGWGEERTLLYIGCLFGVAHIIYFSVRFSINRK